MVPDNVAAVAIGRNEGQRLIACLTSLAGKVGTMVYVDSGSTDDSVSNARRLGAAVVSLDLSLPFTAARARNLGVNELLRGASKPRYVLLVDGDCAVQDGWIEHALAFLEEHPEVAAVCGRRRERHPQRSLYNLLCDWEWNTPIGEALVCGGDAVMRLQALQDAGLYDEAIIAGEDEEVCLRIGKAGWKIWRLEAEMTLHDADITRFSQWWKRMVRAGHAFANVGSLHPEYYVSQRSRIWFWAIGLPLAAVAGIFASLWITAAGIGLYLLSWCRSSLHYRRYGMSPLDALLAGGLLVLSKFANLQGYVLYWLRRATSVRPTLIEYK